MIIVHHNRLYRRWWDETMTKRRRADYFDHVTVMDTFAAEVRLFGFGRTITSAYQAVRKGLREGRLRLARRESIARIVASAIALVGLGVLMVWMLHEALEGRATIGDLALFYQSINQGQGIVRGLLGGVSGFYTNALFLEQLFSLLDLESKQVKSSDAAPVPKRVASGVEFEDVWFTYPGASRPSLKGLSIVLPADRIAAIVGANGAGKSTLLKLMCRFYEVDRGRILIDGVDISSMERDEIYKAISVLFQSPVKHQDTAWANISLSKSDASKEEIIEAAKLAGAHEFIDKLPRGFDSVLGKYFYEGAELSGGQWQRVALARAYLRKAPIMVLDEPTSAMDSWSEMEWFERFRSLAQGKVAAIITHRFTVAMQADKIFVMDDGKIVEEGTHRELLRLDGVYASSWKEQMRRAEQAERSPSVPSYTASGVG
jgi:ATP-binding cassette subfamily B protein